MNYPCKQHGDRLTDFPVYSAKTKKRVKYGILGSGLIVVLVMAALLTRSPVLDPLPGKISVSMEAQVYRDGVLVDERVNDDDMILDRFFYFLNVTLCWPNNTPLYFTEDDVDGNTCDFLVWNETSEETIADVENSDAEPNCMYGEGGTAPFRDDYELAGLVGSASITSMSTTADTFTLTFIEETAPYGFNWKETGLTMTWWADDQDAAHEILMCRDTFTQIVVSADDTLVINYIFTFGTGYTTNFMTFLRYILYGSPEDVNRVITMTDTGGTSRSVRIYAATVTEDFFGHMDNTNYGGTILVSDSASGIPSRSAYHLLGSSLQTYAEVSVDEVNWEIDMDAIFVPTSAITIVAAGYERYTAHSAGDAYFLFFALSHSAVYVGASSPVRASFMMEM